MAAAASSTARIVISSAVLYFLLLYSVALTAPHLTSKLPLLFAEPNPRDPAQIAKIRSKLESRGYSLAASTIAEILRDGDWELREWLIQNQIERGDPITFLVPSDSSAAAAAAAPDETPRPVMGILCAKLRRRDFDLANGTALPSCRGRRDTNAVTVIRTEARSENDAARVADWSLYDDGRVIVHGVRGTYYHAGMPAVLTAAGRGISGEGIVVAREEWEKDAKNWLLEKPVDFSGCGAPPPGQRCDCCRLKVFSHTYNVGIRNMKKEVLVF